MGSIGARVWLGASVEELAALSRGGLDCPLHHAGELLVAVPRDEAVILGAYQRASELATSPRLLRRGSGGGEAMVGPGTVWLQLALARSDALLPCAPERLLNRHVRPLLRAITKLGVLAHYFERDWVSAAKRPVASIAFSHDASSGRAFVEALVAVTTPFAVRVRASMMGKAPATLAELGMRAEASAVAEGIAEAYVAAYGGERAEGRTGAGAGAGTGAGTGTGTEESELPWAATREEGIGIVAAGRDGAGRLRVGGEMMASRDAMTGLEEALGALPDEAGEDAVGALVDARLGAPGVALFGIRSLRSVRDVIVEARAQPDATAQKKRP